MNDYDNIKDLELSSYKSIGSLNEDNLIATNDLSDVISAICYNLSSMLDKRDEKSVVSGSVDISGDLSVNSRFAQGYEVTIEGAYSHAEGIQTYAKGIASHAEGGDNITGKSSPDSGDELLYSIAEGYASHSEGAGYAKGRYSHAEGGGNSILTGDWAGHPTRPTAEGAYSHAEGSHTWAYGSGSHAEGDTTKAEGTYSHAEGYRNKAIANYSHVEGHSNTTNGIISHAEGYNNTADGEASHVEGKSNTINGKGEANHLEGVGNIANVTSNTNIRSANHIEGRLNTIIARNGVSSNHMGSNHAEGISNKITISDASTTGEANHIEGKNNQILTLSEKESPYAAHVEGYSNNAYGAFSHAEGNGTTATGNGSHAAGRRATAENDYQFVWNGVDANYDPSTSYGAGAGTFCINPQDCANGFFIGDKSFADYLSSLSDDLDASIERKLDKYDGGVVSNDVAIFQHSMNILSGNYIQTDDQNGYVQNYSAKNSFLQAECPQKYYDRYGIACTGAKGYCILSVNTAQKYIRLSGDLTELIEFNASKPDALFSTSFGSTSYSQEVKIVSVVQDNSDWGHVITNVATKVGNQTSSTCINNWNNDDNAFYCPKSPNIGNTTIPVFYGSHAEGAATKAIQRCTHAEGRNTLADIRYSHAEGSDTEAAEMYSHAEGNCTKAFGRAAHAEGLSSYASGHGAHAEGGWIDTSKTPNTHYAGGTATGGGSHAEGIGSRASSVGTHAEGWSTYATSYAAHAEGNATSADVRGAHSEGGFGYDKSISSYNASGNVTKSTIVNILYNGTYAHKMAAHAEGAGTYTEGFASHAEGCGSYINSNGHGAHAEGGEVKSTTHKEYDSSGRLSAQWTQYECINSTSAMNVAAHAEGLATYASGKASHAAGISAVAKDQYSYVWNGIDTEQLSSNGQGTFNIYPVDDTKGFYIGGQNLCSIISAEINSAQSHSDSAVQQLKNQISSVLSTIVADPLSSLTYSSDIDNVISAAVEMRNILSNLYDAMRS